MGRLFACVLLVAACGDNLIVDPSSSKTASPFGEQVQPTARVVPAVCSTSSWSLPFARTPSVDVAIAAGPKRTFVMVTPTTGGEVNGFLLSDGMSVVSDTSSTKLGIDGFSTVASAIVNDRMIAAGLVGDDAQVQLFDGAFQNPVMIGKLPATAVAKAAVMQLGPDMVIATGGANGLSVTKLLPSFHLGETELVGASSPVTSLTAAQYGESIVATWTTADRSCYVQRLAQFTAGTPTHALVDCEHAQIATNEAANETRIVFEGPGGLRTTTLGELKLDGFSTLLRADARSPRIAFDGERYWVSYIDPRDNIVAGFIDAQGQLISTAIEGPAPQRNSYELSIVDGKPTVFSLDMHSGYQANSLCVTADAD